MNVRVFHGSVLDAEADAIVNAANTELRHGGGVARAILEAAGPDFARESSAVGPCLLGSAVATGAGRLPFRAVLHVPTVDYRSGGRAATAEELQNGTAAALGLAAERGCRRVAFPLLGAGIAGFAPATACLLMRRGFEAAERAGCAPEQILVCAFTDIDRAAADKVFAAPATGSD